MIYFLIFIDDIRTYIYIYIYLLLDAPLMGRHGRYWPGGATSGRTLVGGPGGKFGGTFENIYLNMIYQ